MLQKNILGKKFKWWHFILFPHKLNVDGQKYPWKIKKMRPRDAIRERSKSTLVYVATCRLTRLHQAITRTHVDLSSMGFCGTFIRQISHEMIKIIIRKMSLKNLLLNSKITCTLLSANELNNSKGTDKVSGIWCILFLSILIYRCPFRKLINGIGDQHQLVIFCWAFWHGMICYHVMVVTDLDHPYG